MNMDSDEDQVVTERAPSVSTVLAVLMLEFDDPEALTVREVEFDCE